MMTERHEPIAADDPDRLACPCGWIGIRPVAVTENYPWKFTAIREWLQHAYDWAAEVQEP